MCHVRCLFSVCAVVMDSIVFVFSFSVDAITHELLHSLCEILREHVPRQCLEP